MADDAAGSVPDIIRGLLDDTRDLMREEIALARAEIREEISAAQTVAVSFGAAALAAAVGAVLLCVAVGNAVAYFLNWPAWAGYGIVAVVLLIGAYVLAMYGRKRLAHVRALPRTTETVKENLAWMQSKSARK